MKEVFHWVPWTCSSRPPKCELHHLHRGWASFACSQYSSIRITIKAVDVILKLSPLQHMKTVATEIHLIGLTRSIKLVGEPTLNNMVLPITFQPYQYLNAKPLSLKYDSSNQNWSYEYVWIHTWKFTVWIWLKVGLWTKGFCTALFSPPWLALADEGLLTLLGWELEKT